jgi:hypothetical protein
MGHGFDELGEKGVIIVEFGNDVKAAFRPLDTIRFYDESLEAGDSPFDGLTDLLPAVGSDDFYRVTFTGYSEPLDLITLRAQFPQFPNLTLRDETLPEPDLWSCVGEDTLEGVYFGHLKQLAASESEVIRRRAKLAARISRQILDGQEVILP